MKWKYVVLGYNSNCVLMQTYSNIAKGNTYLSVEEKYLEKQFSPQNKYGIEP